MDEFLEELKVLMKKHNIVFSRTADWAYTNEIAVISKNEMARFNEEINPIDIERRFYTCEDI